MAMTQASTQTTRERSSEIQILHAPEELDLATADRLAEQGCAASAHAWLLLLDLSDLSFCDARGLSALVKIANHADQTGCRYGLISPRPQVAKVIRICRLDQRLPVFATIDDALEHPRGHRCVSTASEN
jgi:anti-anti-sigma factor